MHILLLHLDNGELDLLQVIKSTISRYFVTFILIGLYGCGLKWKLILILLPRFLEMRNHNSNSKKIHKKQLRSLVGLYVRSVVRSLKISSRPDPTSEDHTRIVESVHHTNFPNLDRSDFDFSPRKNSPKSILIIRGSDKFFTVKLEIFGTYLIIFIDIQIKITQHTPLNYNGNGSI